MCNIIDGLNSIKENNLVKILNILGESQGHIFFLTVKMAVLVIPVLAKYNGRIISFLKKKKEAKTVQYFL